MVRSMMAQANLPISFLGDALLTAAYILNRVPSQSVSSTPHELWNNQKPNLNHLRSWGAARYVHSTSHKFGKLGPRARKHIFIRYSDSSKGYVMYGEHPDGGGMTEVESRDVIFLENEYPNLGETSKNLNRFESEDSGSILPSLSEGGANIPYPIANDNRSDPQSSGSIPDNKSVSPQNIQDSQVRKSKRGNIPRRHFEIEGNKILMCAIASEDEPASIREALSS
ncbi:hypothetical protein CFOL_v3_19619 [Cephalotus follicularis]|uniref:Retroviral polymerase SH3-like domain-containing protein n=1 Tax=Cephalotus follicularis TaxID=3775 RepID=A0A1Q3C7J2_CEPFO|nr:hypothetical protein CFOL_v3_19619 [Cephalotus follicularis]